MKGQLIHAMARLDQMGDLLERLERLPSVRDKVIVRDKMKELRLEAGQVKRQIFEALRGTDDLRLG